MIKRYDYEFVISMGAVAIATLEYNSRYNSNGGRRPRNFAIAVVSHQVAGYSNHSISISLPDALQLLEDMDLPTQEFVTAAKEFGWQDQVPDKYLQLELPLEAKDA